MESPNPNLQLGTGFKVVKAGATDLQDSEVECAECFERFYLNVDHIIAQECPSCGQMWHND
jgi:hypothetical protein